MPAHRSVRAARSKLGTRGQPEVTRAAILDAAMAEFARSGLAGARTDAIAREAGVNKALLYYYFSSKEKLYDAVIERVFSGLLDRINPALEGAGTPRDRVLAYAAAHFDYIAGVPEYPRLVYRELMRIRIGDKQATRGGASYGQAHKIVANYFKPTFRRVTELIREGIASGDFRPVDPTHFMLSMVACIVFYFTSTPVLQAVTGVDPLAPERVAVRRAAVLDLISAGLFANPPKSSAHGSRKQRSNT